jgi:hypothetical protein
MVWLLDGYAMWRIQQTLGWRRVVLSQAVWERFVAIPDGVRSQCEDLRIWDLLIFLRCGVGDLAGPGRILNHVGFLASVVNDTRDSCDDLDAADWPPTDFQLMASAGLDEEGSPCLVVTLPQEECLR